MLNRHQRLGRQAEDLAARHLKKLGYTIVERNFKTALGEIDLVARHENDLVFVEVKARSSDRFGSPAEAVTFAKQRKLSMLALEYLRRNGLEDVSARFDVVTVDAGRRPPRVEVIANAFDLAYG